MSTSTIKHSLMRVLLAVFVLTLCLGQFQRVQLSEHLAFYIHEVILVAWILMFSPDIFHEYKSVLFRGRKNKGLALFLIFIILQTLMLQLFHPDSISALYLLRIGMYGQLFFLMRIAIKQKMVTKNDVFSLMTLMGFVIALIGLFQYLVFPDTRWLIMMGWDDHYYRLISTLFDPGFTGLVIAAGFLVYLNTQYKKVSVVSIAIITVFILSILLTYSRATYLALALTLLSNGFLTKKMVNLIIIFAFCALIPFLPRPTGEGVRLERTASISSRLSSNQEAIHSLSLTEVIWGRGLYRDISESKNGLPNHVSAPDNSFIFLFVSLGIGGCTMLLLSLYEYRYLFGNNVFTTILILTSIHSLFNNSLFYIWSLTMLLILLAISSRPAGKSRS